MFQKVNINRCFAALTIILSSQLVADDAKLSAYASLRLQAERVSVDQAIAGEKNQYTGLRDAFSRAGVKLVKPLNRLQLKAVLEMPVNLAQLKLEDPTFFSGFYKSNQAPRVATIAVEHDRTGSLTYGMQWLAYYNYIAYPVDYFSSFYSGFATYASFRREALTYQSPAFAGLTAVVSAVDLSDGSGTAYLDSMQYALSYSHNQWALAMAYQNSHDDRADLLGFSASYSDGPWRLAVKTEQLQSHENVVTNSDPIVYNFYVSYSWEKFTFKAMYADADGEAGKNDENDAFYIGSSYQLGMDYQYREDVKWFVEYFYEQNGYAIYTPDSTSFSPLAGYQNHADGSALALGIRLDF